MYYVIINIAYVVIAVLPLEVLEQSHEFGNLQVR